jgi:A/G-specific adenine glycosylase
LRDSELSEAEILLGWYDQYARIMPWRVTPKDRARGIVPDPYHVWMSEIMLQQTTVASVRDYFVKFTRLWPTIFDLANAKDEDVMAAWAGLGYYARARNLLKCARVVVSDLGGQFPEDEVSLQKLPGIGPYTSAAIASIAFDHFATVLDGTVERVMARYHLIKEPLPLSKETLRGLARQMLPNARFGDYSQAVMDLGATVCAPRNPSCEICPWNSGCKARAAGVEKDLPYKIAKAKKPTRYGTCFVAVRMDGAILLERRPDTALLGGMLRWPGGGWAEIDVQQEPPFDAKWVTLPEQARHTFTHFHLKLRIQVAQVPNDIVQSSGHFVDAESFNVNDLPTVMRKVWKLVPPVA